MSNYSATASASHRPLPSIFELAAQYQAKRNPTLPAQVPSVQRTSGTSSVSLRRVSLLPAPTDVLTTAAANEVLPWDSDGWLASWMVALQGKDHGALLSLGNQAKQAMEDAEARSDITTKRSIASAAAKARQAQLAADEQPAQCSAPESPVPNKLIQFGPGASVSDSASSQAAEEDFARQALIDSATPKVESGPTGSSSRSGARKGQREFVKALLAAEAAKCIDGIPKGISRESRETLKNISEDFVLYAPSGNPYHVAEGIELTPRGFKDFCQQEYGYVVGTDLNGTEVRAPSGAIWLSWADRDRRSVLDITMEPTHLSAEQDAEEHPTVLNRWHILSQGIVDPDMSATRVSILPLENHLLFLSDHDQIPVDYALNMLAQLYKTPGIKIPAAQLLYSQFGRVGKNLYFRAVRNTFGGRPLVGEGSGNKMLTANFDDGISDKWIINLNELQLSGKGSREAYDNFKTMISEEYGSFEGKGDKRTDRKNVAHYIITTNHADALPLMENDGRICVMRCTSPPLDSDYYKGFKEWVDGPGPALMAGAFENWKFPKDWDPYAPVPQTEAGKAMQHAAKGDLYGLVYELIEDQRAPFNVCFGAIEHLCCQMKTLHADSLGRTEVNKRTLGGVLIAICGAPVQCWVKTKDGKSVRQRLSFWRDAEQWKAATPEQRAHHLNYPDAPRVFPVQQPKTEISENE